jgi:hypothetical protein
MTARDEAIQVLYDEIGCVCKQDGEECGACRSEATKRLDLLMPFVVRLAIEQDALQYVTDIQVNWEQTPVYRVVDQ